MEFIWPFMFFSLLIVPVLVLAYFLFLRWRRKQAARYGSIGLLQTAVRPGFRRHVPPLLFLLGLVLLLVALARPQTVVQIPRIAGTVLLAFDVSGSMAAQDGELTRMEAAKIAARTFIEQQPPEVLIGVIAFSDNGYSIQSPSQDREAVLAAVDRLKPQRGTSLGQGVQAALTVLEQMNSQGPLEYSNRTPDPTPSPTPVPPGTYGPASIVLLSDGENNGPPDPLEAARLAAARGVRIYTVGLGSTQGALLELEGFTVRSRLDENLLRAMAEISGGIYTPVDRPEALSAVYEDLVPQLQIKPERMEVTALLAGASILVLLAGAFISLSWFGRIP